MGKLSSALETGAKNLAKLGVGAAKIGYKAAKLGVKGGIGAAKIGYKAAKLGVKGGIGAAKIGYKAAKLGVKGGIGAAKIGYKIGKVGVRGGIGAAKLGYRALNKAAQKLEEGVGYAKQKLPQIKKQIGNGIGMLSKQVRDASRAFKRMIHSQQLMTIGQIIDSEKTDSYKVFLIKKYIQELKRQKVVPPHIVGQIQTQLMKKVLDMHGIGKAINVIATKPNIRLTQSFMIPEPENKSKKTRRTRR